MPPHSSHHPLRIMPKELVFPAPLNRVITNILKLHNVTQAPVAYKVKTTAPQRYCVRPNNGVLSPGETIEVQVLLNYVKDAPPSLDIKDKFQIQSIVLTGQLSNTEVGEVWAKATNEQIIKQKLKSRFTATNGATTSSSSSSIKQPSANPLIPAPSQQEQLTHDTPTTSTTTQTPEDVHPTISQATQSSPQPSLSSSQSQSQSQSQTQSQSSLSSSQTQLPSLQPTKKPLAESDSHYLTPLITSIAPQDLKHEIPTLDSKPSKSDSQSELNLSSDRAAPKQTGDYVVDTVANFSQLRKTLEQVAALKAEREGFVKDNQKLNEHIKSLTDQLQRSKEEHHQTGLRQRTAANTHQGQHTLAATRTDNNQQMLIQIQTKILLFVVLFFAVLGFLLGRYTR